MDMTLNYVWWSDSSSGDLVRGKYSFIVTQTKR